MHGPSSVIHRTAYRTDIDGLRAIAVMLVLGFHAFPNLVPGGFVGVDVFFVISGFLITGIITTPGFAFSGFYARRARRLFPALAIVIAASLAFGWFHLTPAQFEALGREAAAGVLFVPNFLFWSEAGYFDPTAATKPLLHLWSLGVEEQFCLVWPVLLLIFRKRRHFLLWTVTLASLVYYWNLAKVDPTAAFYSPLARAWELSAGALLSLSGRRIVRGAGLCMLVGIVAIGWASFEGHVLHQIVAAATGALLIIGAAPSRLSRVIFENGLSAYIGKISYPIYLWHWPIFSLLFIMYGEPPSATVASVALLAAVLLAILTHQLVEIPVKRVPLRISALASLSLLAAIGLFGGFVVLLDGMPRRLPESLHAALAYEHYDYATDAYLPGCWLSDREAGKNMLPLCIRARQDDIAIWGDSRAARLSPGLRLTFGTERISQLTRNACPPLLGYGEKACQDGNDYVLGLLRSNPQQTVILFASWKQYDTTFEPGSIGAKALSQTIEEIRKTGTTTIVLVGPTPTFLPSLPSLIQSDWIIHGWSHVPERIVFDQTETRAIDANLSAFAATIGVRYVSLFHEFCNEQGCMTKTEGSDSELVTWDLGHLTTSGALIAARRIATSAMVP